jgi:hypothetical protein
MNRGRFVGVVTAVCVTVVVSSVDCGTSGPSSSPGVDGGPDAIAPDGGDAQPDVERAPDAPADVTSDAPSDAGADAEVDLSVCLPDGGVACCCSGDIGTRVVCNADGTLSCAGDTTFPSSLFQVYYGARTCFECEDSVHSCGGPCCLPCAPGTDAGSDAGSDGEATPSDGSAADVSSGD